MHLAFLPLRFFTLAADVNSRELLIDSYYILIFAHISSGQKATWMSHLKKLYDSSLWTRFNCSRFGFIALETTS